MTPWTKEAVYDEQISPLMVKIIAICKEHQIPMAATFQYCDDEDDGPGFVTTTVPFPRQSERMKEINIAMAPRQPMAFAETITKNDDGSTNISIRRVS